MRSEILRLFVWIPLSLLVVGHGIARAAESNQAQDKPSWIPKISVYNPPAVEKSTSPVFRTVDPQIIQKLIQLLDEDDLGKGASLEEKTDGEFGQNQSVKEINTYVTPEGFKLKERYTYLGVALSESLGWEQIKHVRVISEQNLKQRLTTVARWDHAPNVRSIALIALASLKDKNDVVYFKEALWSRNIGIRYATIEALLNWGDPQAIAILQGLAKDESFLIRVAAAGALAKLGDAGGLQVLRDNLSSKDWFVRSLSAKYIGEEGNRSDYERLLNQLDREQIELSNEFVTSEMAIGALKLFPLELEFQKQEKERKKRKNAESAPVEVVKTEVKPRQNVLLELEPLVVTAPRLKIPKFEPIDPRINYKLLKILQNKSEIRISAEDAARSVAYQDLNKLVTPNGKLLVTRYTVLGYLLTEGLAGSKEFEIQDALVTIARESKNPDVRSFALIALAFSREQNHMYLFQNALRSDNPADRFAAVEALAIWGYPEAVSVLSGVAKLDRSPVIKAYASQAVLRLGNPIGHDFLIPLLDDRDWVARAMAMRYLGELGTGEDYNKMLGYLASDQKPIVQAEMCSALLRLYAKRYEAQQKEIKP